jgi:hypothetical protein
VFEQKAPDVNSAELVTVTDISHTFPGLPSPFVPRPTLTSVLGSLLSKDFDAVFLEGASESGKTIILADFAQSHPRRTISLFLRSVTEFTYDPNQIRFELSNQMNWHLFGKPLSVDEFVDGGQLRDTINRLARKAHGDKTTYIFVVDGLADIPIGAASTRSQILQLLPIGVRQFRFLISGSPVETGVDKLGKVRSRIQQITDFGFDEARELFSGTALTSKQVQEVHRSCSGRVGRMASVLRLIEGGAEVETLLDTLPDIAPGIFEIEWQRIPLDNPRVAKALAFSVYTSEIATVSTVARLVGLDPEELKALLATIKCIKLDPHGNRISFVSESFRKFAAARLQDKESEALSAVIGYLNDVVAPGEAFQTMPGYLERAGDVAALIAFVNTQTACDALARSRSVSLVSARLTGAATVAKRAGRMDAALRYQIQACALRSVLYRRRRKQQVSATLATQGETSALELASAAAADEERICLLALVARSQRASGVRVNPQTLQEIDRLANSIDWIELKQQAFDIASEILPVAPEVGLRILESSVDRVGDPNGADWAIAAAFFRAAEKNSTPEYGREFMDAAWTASKSIGTRSFFTAAAVLTTAESPSDLYLDVDRLQSTGDKVLLLRLWLQKRAAHPEAGTVAKRLIDIVLADADYSPNPAAFLGVVRVVTRKKEKSDETAELIRIVESQLPQLKKAGPFGHYIRLLSELALARSVLAESDPLQPLVAEAIELEEVKDPSLRATCFASILNACDRISSGHNNSDEWDLTAFAEAGLAKAVNDVLRTVAEQFEALRGLITPLLPHRSQSLFGFIEQVNTEERRDRLLEECSKALIQGDVPELDAESRYALFEKLLSRVASAASRQAITLRMIDCLCDVVTSGRIGCLEKMLPILKEIIDPDSRAIAASNCFVALKKQGITGRIDAVESVLHEGICGIQDLSQRIDIGFEAAATLAVIDPASAKKLYVDSQRLALSNQGVLAGCKAPLMAMLRLACRALAALERARIASDADWLRVRNALGELPSRIEQAELWGSLALSVWSFSQQRSRSLVEEDLKPRLRKLLRDAPKACSELQQAIVTCAPALWLHHSATINEFLEPLDGQSREEAYNNILEYLIDGRIPEEPWKRDDRRVQALTFESASDCVRALSEITSDSLFFQGAESIFTALRHKSNEGRINKYQRTEIVRKLDALGRTVLPDRDRGIRHDGFLVLFEAESLATSESGSPDDWANLVVRSETLPNSADCVFVLAHMLKIIPRKLNILRRRAFDSADRLLLDLHFLEDRMDRSQFLAESAAEYYPAEARRLLKQMLEESLLTDRPSVESRRMRTLDTMHRLDEEAATALASVTDTDPVSTKIRERLKTRLEERAVSAFVRDPSGAPLKESPDLVDISEACYRELGSLNAMRVTSRTHSQNEELLSKIKDTTVNAIYPIVAFAIEATSVRYHATDQANDYLRPLFVAVLESLDLTLAASTVLIGGAKRIELQGIELAVSDVELIAPGQRDRAFSVIEKWLANSKSTYIKICDPYFRAADLELLKMLKLTSPRLEISILTSRKAARTDGGQNALSEFEVSWRRTFGGHSEQPCFVVIVGGKKSGLFGVHDRWILLEDIGVSLGTSVSSIGGDRAHTLARLDAETKAKCEAQVDSYLSMQEKYLVDDRLVYESFTLVGD